MDPCTAVSRAPQQQLSRTPASPKIYSERHLAWEDLGGAGRERHRGQLYANEYLLLVVHLNLTSPCIIESPPSPLHTHTHTHTHNVLVIEGLHPFVRMFSQATLLRETEFIHASPTLLQHLLHYNVYLVERRGGGERAVLYVLANHT